MDMMDGKESSTEFPGMVSGQATRLDVQLGKLGDVEG